MSRCFFALSEIKVSGSTRELYEMKVIGNIKCQKKVDFYPQLSTMDVLDLVTMKDAASCDTQCDLQTSENH